MNSTAKSLVFWSILFVVGLLVWNFSSRLQRSENAVPFSEFVSWVDAGQVQRVTIVGNDITGEATLSMMTLEGKVLFSTIVSGNEYKANVSELPAGIYLLKVRTENGQAVKKLTIK